MQRAHTVTVNKLHQCDGESLASHRIVRVKRVCVRHGGRNVQRTHSRATDRRIARKKEGLGLWSSCSHAPASWR